MVNFMVEVSELSGKSVITNGGKILGEIKGTLVNVQTWQVTHLTVKLSNDASEELGFKKRFRSSTVKLPVSFGEVGDVVTVNKNLKELGENPEFTNIHRINQPLLLGCLVLNLFLGVNFGQFW
jgi:sporulation protein YlmC with PRC-barrel domain